MLFVYDIRDVIAFGALGVLCVLALIAWVAGKVFK